MSGTGGRGARTNPWENQRPAPGELVMDHVAHFVPDLNAAGELLEALGFTPSPVSNHQVEGKPAGTANRCLMFEAGYVEILAPTLDTPNARRVRAHMSRGGAEAAGIHLVCFGTPDARAEHARLATYGFEPEPLVRLSRVVDDGRTVRFNVIYVPPGKMPEARVQYCEQLTPEVIWIPEHVRHENGVKALGDVYVVATDPERDAARWGLFSGCLPRPDGALVRLDTSRGSVFLGTRAELSRFLPVVPEPPAVAAFQLKVEHPGRFAARCLDAGAQVHDSPRGGCVALPPELGGCWLFSERA